MDIFTQKKLLVRFVIALTVLNLILISVFLWKEISNDRRPPFPPHGYRDVSGILKEKLNLTQQQADEIDRLRADIFERERVVLKTLRSQRDSMNSEMFNKTTNTELVKSLAKRISENEYKMEMLRFEQANELKNICTPEQLEKFGELVIEIRDYFRPNNQPIK